MLQVAQIKANKEAYIKALEKRNFKAEALFEEVLQLDETRRTTQAELDQTLAESNRLSKEIGLLFKSGEQQKANKVKEQTGALKETSKELNEKLNEVSNQLNEILYTIPNVPHDSVPAGVSEDDNEEIFKEGEIPTLEKDALPHWELAKKRPHRF
jgi:seryl-tRNA synthetase